jgi:hypothetical protein
MVALYTTTFSIKQLRILPHNTLAHPVLLYGGKSWSIKARDSTGISAAEMKYMRRTYLGLHGERMAVNCGL